MTLNLYPADPKTLTIFAHTKENLSSVLKDAEIHHIGSTAVPNLSGKGIIDILIAIPSWGNKDEAVELLKQLGYTHIHPEENNRIFLSRVGDTKKGDVHIHLTYIGSPEYQALLAFRDYLLTHPLAVSEYLTLKQSWLEQGRGDRQFYSQSKSSFIAQILSLAKMES